jgi:hypothetical protein
MEAGYDVVFIPEPIMHAVDPAGRDLKRYLKTVTRNDCFGSLLNEPWPMPFVSVPVRLMRYIRMRKRAAVADPGGLMWIVRQVTTLFPAIWQQRRAVSWATIRRWRRLRREWPAYRRAA